MFSDFWNRFVSGKITDQIIINVFSIFHCGRESEKRKLAIFICFFVGTCTFKLTSIPRPAKASVQCTLETMGNKHTDSIFKKKHVKGWWPFGCSREDSEPELVGKVEVELELLSQQEAEQDPAGLGRKEPNPLPFPE